MENVNTETKLGLGDFPIGISSPYAAQYAYEVLSKKMDSKNKKHISVKVLNEFLFFTVGYNLVNFRSAGSTLYGGGKTDYVMELSNVLGNIAGNNQGMPDFFPFGKCNKGTEHEHCVCKVTGHSDCDYHIVSSGKYCEAYKRKLKTTGHIDCILGDGKPLGKPFCNKACACRTKGTCKCLGAMAVYQTCNCSKVFNFTEKSATCSYCGKDKPKAYLENCYFTFDKTEFGDEFIITSNKSLSTGSLWKSYEAREVIDNAANQFFKQVKDLGSVKLSEIRHSVSSYENSPLKTLSRESLPIHVLRALAILQGFSDKKYKDKEYNDKEVRDKEYNEEVEKYIGEISNDEDFKRAIAHVYNFIYSKYNEIEAKIKESECSGHDENLRGVRGKMYKEFFEGNIINDLLARAA